MSWLDYLKNVGTNIKENTSGLANKILHANAPTLPVLQMADNGEIDLQKSFELSMAQPKTPREQIMGRTFTINSEAKNPETGELEVSQVSKFQPGLLNDIRSGAKENFATGFAAPNWEETKTPDGRKRGLGYRFGEGLGSLARFAESPLGRSLLMAGLVGATGGGGLEALTYGASAGMGNQQNRMKDRAYRDSIIKQRQEALMPDANFQTLSPVEQQQKLDAIANEVNSIKGYFNDNTFRNMVDAQIAQENAAYKRLYLDTQKKNQEAEEQMAKQKFDYQQKKDAQDFALAWEKLKADKENQGKPSINNILSMANHFDTLPEVKNFKEIDRQFGNVEKTYNSYVNGEIKANAADQALVTTLNKILDPTSVVRESEFARTAQGQSALAKIEGYAKKITKGGSGLTDRERQDLYNTMKLMRQSAYETYKSTADIYTDMAYRYGINPNDIIRYNSTSNQGGAGSSQSYSEGTIIKDKQGNRLIMRGGQWQAI